VPDSESHAPLRGTGGGRTAAGGWAANVRRGGPLKGVVRAGFFPYFFLENPGLFPTTALAVDGHALIARPRRRRLRCSAR